MTSLPAFYLLRSEATMDHLSTLKLHRLRYGELDAAEAEAVQEHLEGCDLCSGRLRAQGSHARAFALQPVPVAIAQAAEPTPWQRLLGSLRDTARWWAPAIAVAAGIALAVNVQLGERLKGAPGDQIEVLVEGYGVLEAGELLRPGDRIQLRLPPGEWIEVWVGDGEGWLGRFPVEPGKRHLAPFSLEVDGAPGPEQVVVLLANHPLQEQEAAAALAGKRPGGTRLEVLNLPKEVR